MLVIIIRGGEGLLCRQDEKFWQGLTMLSFAAIPHLQDSVVAVGYPRGGDSLSVTKGRLNMGRQLSWTLKQPLKGK